MLPKPLRSSEIEADDARLMGPDPSTGIKAEGEGEWNARKHGGPKRRLWRKIHIGIDDER